MFFSPPSLIKTKNEREGRERKRFAAIRAWQPRLHLVACTRPQNCRRGIPKRATSRTGIPGRNDTRNNWNFCGHPPLFPRPFRRLPFQTFRDFSLPLPVRHFSRFRRIHCRGFGRGIWRDAANVGRMWNRSKVVSSSFHRCWSLVYLFIGLPKRNDSGQGVTRSIDISLPSSSRVEDPSILKPLAETQRFFLMQNYFRVEKNVGGG